MTRKINFSDTTTTNKKPDIKTFSSDSVNMLIADEGDEGQRIDNFLLKRLKGVPKSHIYRILRSGEVRVNSKRIPAEYRLHIDDKIRVPPIRVAEKSQTTIHVPSSQRLADRVLFEDDSLLVINKPAGLAVHGGSGISQGVIEQIRVEFPNAKFLELVHRLDKETSGILVLAKKRSALTGLHALIREGKIEKHYFALAVGEWKNKHQTITFPLTKYVTADGERRVFVHKDGLASRTIFTLIENFDGFSLLEADLKTGRTHQIRVHLAHAGFPIAGDEKYGDFSLNKELMKKGLKRMFLHASQIKFKHPLTDTLVAVMAPLPKELEGFLTKLREHGKTSNDEK